MFWIYIALNNINYSQAFLFYCVLNINGFIKWGKNEIKIQLYIIYVIKQ